MATLSSAEVGISLTVPEADIVRMGGLMHRMVRDLGIAMPKATNIMAWKVVDSLGASTRKSRPTRNYKLNYGADPTHPVLRYPKYVDRYIGGQKVKQYVTCKGYALGWYRKVKWTGLAKTTWAHALSRLHRRAGRMFTKLPGDVMRVTTRNTPAIAEIHIANNLHYILSAMTRKSKPVETAFARANLAVEKYIAYRMERAMRSI
ncbi:hypothetical protein D4Q85_00325 [bacterium]|nr:MAG: hypothetical protein D4Q85_00325 [bacterium]